MSTSPSKTPQLANFKLRPYQLEAVAAALAKRQPGSKVLVVLPTGSGKTEVIVELTEKLSNKQVIVITPRKKLLDQLRKNLRAHGVCSSMRGNDQGDKHGLIIGTDQTISRRFNFIQPDYVILDECHWKYDKITRKFPNAIVIGLTATPYRHNMHITKCGQQWEEIYSISLPDLIKQDYLVPPHSMATQAELNCDLADRTTLTEVTKKIVPALVSAVREEGREKILVFCTDIAHAESTASLLGRAGEKSVDIVHSKQPKLTRDKAFGDFETSTGRSWLVNVGLVTMGVNIPKIDCIAILRSITSFALLVQIIGRGLRLYPGKLNCLISDFLIRVRNKPQCQEVGMALFSIS